MAVSRRNTSPMNHPVVITFLILAIVGAMSLASEVLKPLALSVLLAFALTPLSRFWERRKVPRAPAVVLTLALTMGALGAIGFVVGEQMTQLATTLPKYKEKVKLKLKALAPKQDSTFDRVQGVFDDVASTVTSSPVPKDSVSNVRVVQEPTFRERLQSYVGPYLEFLGVGSFVLVLVLFMMLGREDLRDRILHLFGQTRVSVTTKTMDEIAQRISRYLATFAVVNSCYGLVIGVGLWAIGLPLAVLWGCLAGLTRFIPYVGPAVAFALPMLFSVAYFPGWYGPIAIFVLFAVVESALNSYLEPVIYGKTTGVSALGLLVAAMFWTWLWGLMGLLLSTPLTVCLAVLGKYVPSLGVFATLLGEETELEPAVRFYQRLIALDRDSAEEVVEAALKSRPRADVFDDVIVPALSHAERDAYAGNLEDQDLAFIWRVVGEIVDDLEGTSEITLSSVADESARLDAGEEADPGSRLILGVACEDTADAIVLKMLGQLLGTRGLTLEVVGEMPTAQGLAEEVARRRPAMVVFSHLPPRGLTSARNQVRRLHGRSAGLPIVFGLWCAGGAGNSATERLTEAGASAVVTTLASARAQIIEALCNPPAATPAASPGLVKIGT